MTTGVIFDVVIWGGLGGYFLFAASRKLSGAQKPEAIASSKKKRVIFAVCGVILTIAAIKPLVGR
jgi:hypothetical protein